MIEETGRVTAVEPGAVWVETLRKSTCSACSARAGCGQGLLGELGLGQSRGHVRALSDLKLSVGDAVVIGVREDLLVRGSLLVYLLPLLGLFAGALLMQSTGAAEPWVVASGFAGMLLAWYGVRKRSALTAHDPALQPVVMRRVLVAARTAF